MPEPHPPASEFWRLTKEECAELRADVIPSGLEALLAKLPPEARNEMVSLFQNPTEGIDHRVGKRLMIMLDGRRQAVRVTMEGDPLRNLIFGIPDLDALLKAAFRSSQGEMG
jgi:hypothetical protein